MKIVDFYRCLKIAFILFFVDFSPTIIDRLFIMSILSDIEIIDRVEREKMIEPFCSEMISAIEGKKIVSYGLSSYGYDARVFPEYKIFTNVNNGLVDPKNFTEDNFIHKSGDTCVIPPNSFVLARTIEYFRIPRDCLAICLGKSTYARCGIVVNVTPLEPEWEGHVTLEFSNTTNLPAKIYSNEGVCQFLFLKASTPCQTSYKDRKGKYQGQTGITLPKMQV